MNLSVSSVKESLQPTKTNIGFTAVIMFLLAISTLIMGGINFPFSMVNWTSPSSAFAIGPVFGSWNWPNIGINLIGAYLVSSLVTSAYKNRGVFE